MASITSLGTGSGLDLEGIVTKLMTVESQPLSVLTTRQTTLQTKLSAYGTLQGTFSALQLTAQSLSTKSTFTAANSSVSDASALSVTSRSGAAVGSYAISVSQLAQAQASRSNSDFAAITDTFNTGTIDISVGGATATTITIDSNNNTLSGIRNAINAAKAGVTASIVNDGTTNRLLLSSQTTGLTAGAFTLSVTDSGSGGTNALTTLDSSSLVQTQAPLDALFSVNGLNLSRSKNTISDAIDKVTLTLNKAGTIANPLTTQLTVAKDNSSIQSSITNFVSAYNSAINQMKSLSAYDATTNKSSILTGDGTVRNIQRQFSATIFTSVPGVSGGINMLSDIGISVQKDGTLAVDSVKLQAALADPDKDVGSLFNTTATSGKGIAVRMNDMLTTVLGSNGLLASRTDGITQSIKSLDSQRTALSNRLSAIEANYRARFAALDTTVASMQGTSTYLTQQLDYIKSLATGK